MTRILFFLIPALQMLPIERPIPSPREMQIPLPAVIQVACGGGPDPNPEPSSSSDADAPRRPRRDLQRERMGTSEVIPYKVKSTEFSPSGRLMNTYV